MRQQGEASVEEILDSIKKVIARDNRDGAIAERRRRAMEGVPEPVDEDEAEEVFDLSDAELVDEAEGDQPDDDFDNDFEADDAAAAAPPGHDQAESPLITSRVRSSMQENFAALAMLSEPSARPQIVRSGETSLEGLVREMLRPMLAEWIDANLPGMVEKMVKDEIARIARKRG